jgi:hypothetical protein
MTRNEFKDGVCFKLRHSHAELQCSFNNSASIVFNTSNPDERMFIELRVVGAVFWNYIAGVEIKSRVIFYGDLILVSQPK